MADRFVDAEVYLQVDPEWWQYRDRDAERAVRGARVVRLTQNRPTKPVPGTVLVKVKVTIRIPKAAFLPLRPEAVVTIPEDMTLTAPIEVEAGDPS